MNSIRTSLSTSSTIRTRLWSCDLEILKVVKALDKTLAVHVYDILVSVWDPTTVVSDKAVPGWNAKQTIEILLGPAWPTRALR